MIDFAVLQDFVYENRVFDSNIHGLAHWRQVEFNGVSLEEKLLDITQEQFEKLYHACKFHTKERSTGDATIDTCYDADRLDLGRVGFELNPHKMATAAGAKIARKSLTAGVDVYEMREWLKTVMP